MGGSIVNKHVTACGQQGTVKGSLRARHSRRIRRAAHTPGAGITSGPAPSTTEEQEVLHEVRGSLAAVGAAVRALTGRDNVVPAERRERIERLLREEVDRLQRLVAVPGHADSEQPVAELDLDEIVETVVLGRRLAGHRVSWEPSGHVVLGRRDEVVEVLNILLVNAARHAAEAPARVSVERAADRVRLRVSDDGPGVPEELRPDIFDRGIRSQDTGGQGVGLSMARSLARGLGGTLDLEDVERGASFELTLPAVQLGGAA